MSNISVPKIIPLNIIITSIAAGWAHSLLLSNEGYVYSFGYGEDGQLGHGK
jgi:alpha-tubulin suppressor-like RCC1 family protein